MTIPPMMASTPRPMGGPGIRTPMRQPGPRGPSPGGMMPGGISPSNIQNMERSLAESRTALKEMQAEFTTYKKERGENERCVEDFLL